MFNLKKYFTDELLQVALILSLLRIDRRSLEYNVPAIGIGTNNSSDSWDQSSILVRREGSVHPKSLDSILGNYEQEVFHELNSLGRYSPIFDTLNSRNLTAYLLNVGDTQTDDDNEEAEAASSVSADHPVEEEVVESDLNLEYHRKGIDSGQLSQEDLDIIETLWKYDVFVENDDSDENIVRKRSNEGGLSPPDEPFAPDGSRSLTPELTNSPEGTVPRNSTNLIDRKKLASNEDEKEDAEEDYAKSLFTDELLGADPWIGASSSLAWLSDGEDRKNNEKASTSDDNPALSINVDEDLPSSAIFGPEFSLEETLQLIDLNEMDQNPLDLWQLLSVKPETNDATDSIKKEIDEEEIKEDPGIEADFLDEELDLFANMIHSSGPQNFHSRPFQNRTLPPYSTRTMGVDRSLQSFAPSMNFPSANHAATYQQHHPHSQITSNSVYPSLHQMQPNPTAASIVEADLRNGLSHLNDASAYTSLFDREAAAADSINIVDGTVTETVFTSDDVPDFKVEPNQYDSVYPYQASCNEANQTTDGLISSILGADSLDFVDIAMNDSMYSSMRLLDDGCGVRQHCFERGTDSDSAVSSMDSERVPSLSSDNEWMETNSDSGHTPADHYASDYGDSKYRWYENFLYDTPTPNDGESSSRKKGEYGRRCFPNQNAVNHINHNHTYHTPSDATSEAAGAPLRPSYRDKFKSKSGRKSEEDQLTRDEKKARNQNIPMSVYDIINLPMDEFNEKLSTYDLSESQLSLIRDIRRRGKNKVAAQNCRKRKLDQIMSLADEVKNVKDTKHKLLQEKEFLNLEKQRVQNKYNQLNRHLVQSLRDSNGNRYSSFGFTLQPTDDGNIVIVPRNDSSTSVSLDTEHSSSRSSQSKNKDVQK